MDNYRVSIKNYLTDGEFSICREERQYALFLYNVLCAESKEVYSKLPDKLKDKLKDKLANILKLCGLEGMTVQKVFYEATFMRDFFERDRRLWYCGTNYNRLKNVDFSYSRTRTIETQDERKSFNQRLMEYVNEKGHYGYDVINDEYFNQYMDYHLGSNLNPDDKYSEFFQEIKYLMNSKPDIAVVCKDASENTYLKFIECKFESGESKYGNETQTAIQNKIADFICNDLCKEEFNGGGNDCSKAAILAKFTRKSHETNKIHIGDLIELEKYIWKG